MATPADHRLLELLDKWQKSLALHAEYSALDDDSYWKIQPWAEHQRPQRWIIEVAMKKTAALRAAIEARIAANDREFSDSLELMIFLANLLGSEHIERYIPVAHASSERESSEGTAATTTREMPHIARPARAAAAMDKEQVARTERKPAHALAPRPAPGPPRLGTSPKAATPKAAGRSAKPHTAAASPAVTEQVLADAVRLAQWGRKWFELAELIARMAGRPPLSEVRRILKENKTAIDEKAKGG